MASNNSLDHCNTRDLLAFHSKLHSPYFFNTPRLFLAPTLRISSSLAMIPPFVEDRIENREMRWLRSNLRGNGVSHHYVSL